MKENPTIFDFWHDLKRGDFLTIYIIAMISLPFIFAISEVCIFIFLLTFIFIK